MSRRVSMARKQRNESARPRYACMMLLNLEAVTAAITEDIGCGSLMVGFPACAAVGSVGQARP